MPLPDGYRSRTNELADSEYLKRRTGLRPVARVGERIAPELGAESEQAQVLAHGEHA